MCIRDRSQTDDSSANESESESDDDIQLFRPVFLKRSKGDDATTEKQSKKLKTDFNDDNTEMMRHAALLDRTEKENQLIQERLNSQNQLSSNYSTDQEILRRAIELNDDDSIDPENERKLWLERQDLRSQKRREILVAKQRELEEYEAKKLSNSKNL